jgi:predicted nucleic-acid-binding protein
MLGVDTNVLVRFLVRDDEAQFEKASRLIKREWRPTKICS